MQGSEGNGEFGGIRRILDYRKTHGTGYTLRRLGQKAAQKYLRTYERRREREKCPEAELQRQRENQPDAGLLSLVVPVFNTDSRMLRELLKTIEAQTYRDFEAILYDGKSTREETLQVLREAEEKPPFRVIRGRENLGISGNTNQAIPLARGAWIVLCDHDDLLEPDALWRVAECIARENPDVIYTDEDRISEDGSHHMDPHYKPDYCPDNLVSDNYICHLSAMRKTLLQEIGGLRSGFDGSQDHDLFLRAAEKTDRIAHVPYVLYSWREVFSSASHRNLQVCLENGCRAVTEHEGRLGRKVSAKPVRKEIRLWYEVPEGLRVRALVYGKSEEACRACLRELRERTGRENLPGDCVVMPERGRFAQALNCAVREADGDCLLIMESAARGFNREFIDELLMFAQRADAAMVCPALTDRRGYITGGGYACGMEHIAQCVNEGMYLTAGGWHDMMNKVHNVIAGSLACAMIRKDCWPGLDEEFRGGLAAVDLGLRLRESGKWTVWTPHARAVYPRKSFFLNGTERDPGDAEHFGRKWGREVHDPCYSGRFRREKANYRY